MLGFPDKKITKINAMYILYLAIIIGIVWFFHKWFKEYRFRRSIYNSKGYIDKEDIHTQSPKQTSVTDGGTFTWIIHMYPPKHNAGAEMMAHAMNTYMIRERRAHINVILNKQSIPLYNRVQLIWAKDKPQRTKAILDADVLLSHLDNEIFAVQTAKEVKKPLVLIMHNSFRDKYLGEFKKILPGNLYLIHNSQWIQKYYESYNLPGIVVYPPVDWRDYVVESTREYVTLINMNKNKGGEIFLELVKKMPDIKFLGVKGAYDTQITQEYPNLTLVDNTPKIKELIYSKTGILLMPSKYESWGRTAVEAMASGIPVIASPTPGLLESCGDAGIFCKRDDIAAWEREIRRLKNDQPYYTERSEACKRRAIALDPEPQLEAMTEWLQSLRWKESKV